MSVKDDFTAVKDSVIMGDLNQNFTIPESESFDELIEKLISCHDSKQRVEVFKNNEFEILKGLTEIITISGEYWADLKNCQFERFVSEIFESELRRSVLGSKLHKLSLDNDLKDMQYLWHRGGVYFEGNTATSVIELINCVRSMMNEIKSIDDRYQDFLNAWWWDGRDNYSILEHIFSTLSDYNIKKIYDLCKDPQDFHFNEYMICYLYSSNSINKEHRVELANDLEIMINQLHNPLLNDTIISQLWEDYPMGWLPILLTRAANISERDLGIHEQQAFDHELEQINKLIEKDNIYRLQKNAEPLFTDIKIYSYTSNILENIQKIKDKCKNYPMIE